MKRYGNIVKSYDDMLYDSRPVQFNEFMSNKYNIIHNELYNDALNKFCNDVVNNSMTYEFVYEFYKLMEGNELVFDTIYDEYNKSNDDNIVKNTLSSISIDSYNFLKDIFNFVSEKIDLIKNTITDDNGISHINIDKKYINDFRIIYLKNNVYLRQESDEQKNDDSEDAVFDVFHYSFDSELNTYTYTEEYLFMSEMKDYVILLEDIAGNIIYFNKYGELMLLIEDVKFNSEESKFKIINFINDQNEKIFDFVKSRCLYYFNKNHRILEIKNNEYWQPSSIMTISNVSPYKKNIYDLSKYWNMNQEYSDANIEELKIINENIKDAKLVSINYVNGTAKFVSKINDLDFTVPFKYLNDETIVSDEMKLNNLFRNISAINT